MKRILLWCGGIVLVLFVLVASLAYAFIRIFYAMPPKAEMAKPTSVAQAQRQDLEYFRYYLDLNRAYTPTERKRAVAMLADYEAAAGRMTSAQFELAISRMVALSDNGHSEDHPFLFRSRHNSLPCLLYRFSGGYYIVKALPPCQALLGAKLMAVDGRAIDEVSDRLFAFVRGPRGHFDQYSAPFFLESPELLHAAGLADAPDRLTLRVQMPDGTLRDAPMQADPPDPDWPWWAWSDFDLSPLPIVGEGKGWKSLLPANADLPTFLEQYDLPFRSENWSDRGIYYFAIRFNADFAGHSIREFVNEVRKQIAAAQPRVVIADLRLDKGGDLTTTAGLMSRIPRLSPEIRRVYVLTSAWTFSAGITSAALAKAHGGAKVIIVGEPVGDGLRFWAEGRDMTLPNSGIQIHYATGLHDYRKPCWGERGCFWLMHLYPMHLDNLTPDVIIPYRFSDYRSLRDPDIDYVVRQVRLGSGMANRS